VRRPTSEHGFSKDSSQKKVHKEGEAQVGNTGHQRRNLLPAWSGVPSREEEKERTRGGNASWGRLVGTKFWGEGVRQSGESCSSTYPTQPSMK